MVSKGDVISAAGGFAVALGITYFFLRSSGLKTPPPSGETQACACPPGTQGCNDLGASCQGSCMINPAYYTTTEDISMMTVNLTSKQTQTIQGFVNGQGGQVFPWTGGQNFFTINYGCGPWPTGTFTFYSLTTFADGSQAKSNSVTFQIVYRHLGLP